MPTDQIPIPLDARVVATADQISTTLDGEAMILSIRQGRYFSLNPVGAFVWERLAEPVRVADLHRAILATYAIDPDPARQDLLALLGQLEQAGLIEVRRDR